MKKILLLSLLLLLGYLLFDRFALQIVWVNPNVNTAVFPYISKSLKEIDNAVSHTALAMKSSRLDVKILYKNAYGSGFLKCNSIPNDLDYSIGIYLGEYEFNGENSREIAKQIDEKMSIFQTEFYNYVNTINPDKLYTDYDVLTSLTELFNKREANIESITNSIPKLFRHKGYIVYTDKLLLDENDKQINMTFPFVLRQNEILIEDYSPVLLFTNLVKYSPNTRDMLREITVLTDFYVDIRKGDDIVNAEIVAESFTGQRLQLTRRFFVPVVFTGNSSAKYLKHSKLLTDDDDYIEYRLFNFKRHLQEFSNLKELQERPVKLFKRVLQCKDLILPLLDETTAAEIEKTIETNLNNPKIQLANDWQTAFGNLVQITSLPNLYLKAQHYNKITQHVRVMQDIVLEMKNSNLFNQEDLSVIANYTNDLEERLKLINSGFELKDYNKYLMKTAKPAADILDRVIKESTTDKERIMGYIDTFNEILGKAGFHRVNMCWLDKNLMGISKDEFTTTIPEKDLKQMAKENKLADVEYKFINKSELSGPKVRYAVWVRYKPSEIQEQTWQHMRLKLLADKKNFNIKRRFLILHK